LFAFGLGAFVIYLEGGSNGDFERGHHLGGYKKLPDYIRQGTFNKNFP
jgi:hypothetical protein